MNMQSFLEAMKRMDSYFKSGRQTFKDTLEEYYDYLRDIPGPVFADICKEYRKGSKPTPGYYPTPNDLLMAWQEWCRQHPERISQEYDPTPCDYCDGYGGIVAHKSPEWAKGMVYDYVFRCGHCENWKRRFCIHVPIAEVHEITRRGFVLGYAVH
jgi:hypothetical protein